MRPAPFKAKNFSIPVLVLLLVSAFPHRAGADQSIFNVDALFSGDSPTESTPWLTAVFDDLAAAPGWDVRLTLSAPNLNPGDEFVSEWFFNLDPAIDPTGLLFDAVDVSDTGLLNGQGFNGIDTGTNAFKADGDGYYDLSFNFPPPPGSFSQKFTDGEVVILDIKHASASLAADSFSFLSYSSHVDKPSYFSAAHVQGIPMGWKDGSGWIAATTVVPEPMSAALFLIGAGALAARRFRRRTVQA